MTLSEKKRKYHWRTKYPWVFVFFILSFGIMRGLTTHLEPQFGMNLLMATAFVSYIFLYIFYLFGVRPEELEGWHQKYK